MARPKKKPYKLHPVKPVKPIVLSKLDESEKYSLPFAKNLREYLYKEGCSQKELATNMHVSEQTISNICTGQTEPTIIQIIGICNSLGISADYLLGLSENTTTNPDIKITTKTLNLSQNSIGKLIELNSKKYRIGLNLGSDILKIFKKKYISIYNYFPNPFPSNLITDELLSKDITPLIKKYANYHSYCHFYNFACETELKDLSLNCSDGIFYSSALKEYEQLTNARWELEKAFSRFLDTYYDDKDEFMKKRENIIKSLRNTEEDIDDKQNIN